MSNLTNKKILRLFISQPMNNIPIDEINNKRNEIVNRIKNLNLYDDIKVVNDIEKPKGLEINAGRLWYLGASIQEMDNCDLIIFADGYDKANGCMIEYRTAKSYDVPFLFEDENLEDHFKMILNHLNK